MRFFIIVFLFSPSVLIAQPFQNSSNDFEEVWDGHSVFSDLDNDGDLDIIISGTGNNVTNPQTLIYSNDGFGNYTLTSQKLPGIVDGQIEVGDYDNDGFVDILIVGAGFAEKLTYLFKNNGSFLFEEVEAEIPQVYEGMAKFGDYDNDGDLDLLMIGHGIGDTFKDLYQNNNGIFAPLNLNLPIDRTGAIAWEDYDLDGDLDFVISGNFNSQMILYVNMGNNIFQIAPLNFPGLSYASIDWTDFNDDGWPDILVMGRNFFEGDLFFILKNGKDGSFEKVDSDLEPVAHGNAICGDLDNDGDMDIISTGYKSNNEDSVVTSIYINNNDDSFTKNYANLPQLTYANIAIGDADNDLDLDIILSGILIPTTNSYVPQTFLYINQTKNDNQKPEIPSGQQSVVDGQKVILSWNQALDDHTPSKILNYNLFVGTNSGTGNLKGGHSNTTSGYRKIVGRGNAGNNLSLEIDNLTAGTYYWGVQSIDGSFIGSSFSEEKTFTIIDLPPEINSFEPQSAKAGTIITIFGKNFLGTSSVSIEGIPSKFEIINSTTIKMEVSEEVGQGFIEIVNTAGMVLSNEKFCLIPEVDYIVGPGNVCAGEAVYEIRNPIINALYNWSIEEGGEIIENYNDSIKVNWEGGGDFEIKVIPETCVLGIENIRNIIGKGPVQQIITGNINPKTETREQYSVPYRGGEKFQWSLSGGGELLANTSYRPYINWTQPGTYLLEVARTNDDCPNDPTISTLSIDVDLNEFSFTNAIAHELFYSAQFPVFADFDNDQDLDMITREGILFENSGMETLISHNTNLPDAVKRIVIDVNQDNIPDIYTIADGYPMVYLNQGDANFIKSWESEIRYLDAIDINIIDFDNDGDTDLIIIEESVLILFENTGSGDFIKRHTISDFKSYRMMGKSQVIDLNRDGLMDIAMEKGGVYLNSGTGSFSTIVPKYPGSDFEKYQRYIYGPKESLIWEDVTNDGIPDLTEYTNTHIKIFENKEAQFVVLDSIVGGVSSLTYLDLNHDGFKDMITGESIRLYNPGTKTYDYAEQQFSRAILGVLDLNQDGSNDILTIDGDSLRLFTNNNPNFSTPSIPSTLTNNIDGNNIILNWKGTFGNTFNVVVGTQPNLADVLSPLSDFSIPFKKASTYLNKDTEMSYRLTLTPGTYYWSVQAEAPDGTVSPFAEFVSFTISEPTIPAPSDLTLTTNSSEFILDWSDNAITETGFVIERTFGGFTEFMKIGEVAANTTFYIDSTANVDSLYIYRLRATDGVEFSNFSNKVSSENAIIGYLPYYENFEEPFSFWSQSSDDEDGRDYYYRSFNSSVGNNWERVKYHSSDGEYSLRMEAINHEKSAASLVSPLIDLSGTENPFFTFDFVGFYKNALSDANFVTLRFSLDNGETWITNPINSSSHAIGNSLFRKIKSNLSSFKGEKIRIQVTGFLQDASSPREVQYIDNFRIVEFPLAPQNPVIDQNAPNELRLSWDLTEHATHYIIERRSDTTSSYHRIDTIPHPIHTYTDEGLTLGMTYTYRIRAYNMSEDGSSESSSLVSMEVFEPPFVVEKIPNQRVRVFESIDIPLNVTYPGSFDDLKIAHYSSDSIVLPNKDIKLNTTSSGLICHINANSGVIGNSIVTIEASSTEYKALSSFTLTTFDSQTISFEDLPSKTFGDEPFELVATSSSGLPVSFSSSNENVITIEGNIATIVGSGWTMIAAFQNGNEYYEPAPETSQVLNVDKTNQQITFEALSNKTFGDEPFELLATASSGLPVSFSSSNQNVLAIEDNTATIIGAGLTTITAHQKGNDNYKSAPEVSQNLNIDKTNQQLTFGVLSNKTYGDEDFQLNGFSDSSLPLSYSSSNHSVATIIEDMVTIVGAGTTEITAFQEGDSNYKPASPNAQTLLVNKANQWITFDAFPDLEIGVQTIALNGTASSGLPLTYSSSNPDVASVSEDIVSIKGNGSTNITAEQNGNSNYNPASPVTRTLVILTITSIDDQIENEHSGPQIYPNPTSERVNIVFKDMLNSKQLVLSNIDGRIIQNFETKLDKLELDVSNIKPGIYLISISDNETRYTFKLTIL